MAEKDRERDRPGSGDRPMGRPGLQRSETTVVTDGQVGTHNLERGPERANPEGTVDTSNVDYWKIEGYGSDRRRRMSSWRRRR